MISYEDYQLPDASINRMKTLHLTRWIKDYFTTNNRYPTDEEIELAPIWNSQMEESLKRTMYARYLATGIDPVPADDDTPYGPNDIRNFYQYMIWATYDVIDITNPTQLLYTGRTFDTSWGASNEWFSISHVSRMVIDGKEVTPVAAHTFKTFGEHTIGVLPENITTMTDISFAKTRITKIVIPERIETISNGYYTRNNGVTVNINQGGWNNCPLLNVIVCNPTIVPTYRSNCELYTSEGEIYGPLLDDSVKGVLYCPNGSNFLSQWFDNQYQTASQTSNSIKSENWQIKDISEYQG